MPLGKVYNVNVIAYACAVGRVVIVTENFYLGQFAYRNFGDIRAKVVGNTVGIFADKSARMCAYGIEITQNSYVPAIVCFIDIF